MLEACRVANGAFVGGGYDRAHSRIRLTEELDQFEAVTTWHLKIRDDEVRLKPGSQGETIQPVLRLTGDLNVGAGFQQADQDGPEQGGIVHEDHANLACRCGFRVRS
ncbi:MAG: hypothetical protein NT154_37575 [Verrucomicrobia bacterium]|nr:hypothetical protein [Verrucomicrobiota bacterium]